MRKVDSKNLIRGLSEKDELAMRVISSDAPGPRQFNGEPPYHMQAQFDWIAGRVPESEGPARFNIATRKSGYVSAMQRS